MDSLRDNRDNTTIGRIIDIDRQSRQFTTINEGNRSFITRFNVPENARIFDIFGRSMSFSGLRPGMRVQVRHASFMTAGIPPQTTAFTVQMIR